MRADRKKVEPLLRTARGQLDGVLKMIEDDRYCMEIAAQLQAFTDSWIAGYSDYKPEEVPKLESAVLEQDGVYVVFCVTADNTAAKSAVRSLLHP